MKYLGLDIGKKGGLAALTDKRVMSVAPVVYDDDALDPLWLREELVRHSANEETVLVMEKFHSSGLHAWAALSLGESSGIVRGIASSFALVTVVRVACGTWRKVIFGTGRPAEPKKAAIAFAARVYPEADLAPGRKRTPQDGLAEAVCLAEFGRLTRKGSK